MKPRQICLIDDDEDDREIFQSALSEVDASIICTAFENAKEVLELLAGEKYIPDLIFLDLNMPKMTGQQFLLEIKKNHSLNHIPVIILSTSSHAATIQVTKDLGAERFLSKPDNFEDLTAVIKSVLQ